MKKLFLVSLTSLLFACSDGNDKDLYFDGRLESDIIKISARTTGNLDTLLVDEGDLIKKGQLLAVVDTDRLNLQKQQQQAQLAEINANTASLNAQIKQLQSQLKLNEDLVSKTKDLLSKGAATSQKLDELNTQNEILSAQLEAIKAQKSALQNKKEQLSAGIAMTDLNIKDSRLTAPENGTILNRFFNNSELVNPGMPVFEMANLSYMDATIYVSLTRLTDIKLGQHVEILVDGMPESLQGSILWIASEAEFTPKTILTEETRTSLVYAVKVRINNEQGKLKIGMPIQVKVSLEH
jgi:membrane fusion protein YbhG